MKLDIAVVILNYIQFVSIAPGIEKLKNKGYLVDVYCPKTNVKDGFKEMFDETKKILKNKGYKVFETSKKKEYKVLLEPYPCMDIKAQYKIRYRYGMLSAKPNIVYIPQNYLMYDGVLCCGKYDSNYLKAFTRPIVVGNMKYIDFKRMKHNYSKKVLLYLPTYGEESSIDSIIDILPKIRDKFYVIAKIHHGTSFLKNENSRIKKLKENVDEFYDCFKDLPELLSFSDVVLTDNSGSIFEAMYVNVPVAVYCDDINKNKLDIFNTTQFNLYKKGILPYTNKKEQILNIIKESLSKKIISEQNKWSKENFEHSARPDEDFANEIEKYLKDDINQRYYEFHKAFQKNYYTMYNDYIVKTDILNQIKQENENIKEKLKSQNNELHKLQDEVYYYRTGKLYKIAKKAYEIKNKLLRRKNEKK